MSDFLEVIPLGGLGEFGMNCTALRYGQDMILIDAGVAFPSSHLGHDLGVDVIVPDISFLKENQEQLRAILLTHGHEDHAGSVFYVVNEIPRPLYGSRLTLGLVAEKFKERRRSDMVPLHPIEAREKLDLGPFLIEPLHVTHSFPDAFCFAIRTPVGTIIWTGDYKFDQSPIDRKLSDMTRLSEYGEQGVLALFSDSTNSDRRGLSPSESSLYEPLRGLFRRAEQKIIVACFSSSIHRIQILADLASESNRKLLPVGRSMISNIRTATRLGYLRLPTDLVISSGDLRHLPADRIMILAAGSQGEPMSALSRLAVNELKKVKIEEGDTVILSARIIPGNERLISNMVNHFYRRGTSVYDSRFSEVHVSGHGFRDDLKLMINLTRPEFFIPIHGEFRQLQTHAWLAQDQGISQDNIHIIESGDILKLTSHGAEVSGKATVGRRFIEEGVLEEVHDVVLRDRRYLSADGFLLVVVRLDRFSGELIGDPELISRGFVLAESSEDLMRLVRGEISKTVQATPVEEKQDEELFKKILQKHLKRFLRKKTGKRPMIVSVILEI